MAHGWIVAADDTAGPVAAADRERIFDIGDANASLVRRRPHNYGDHLRDLYLRVGDGY